MAQDPAWMSATEAEDLENQGERWVRDHLAAVRSAAAVALEREFRFSEVGRRNERAAPAPPRAPGIRRPPEGVATRRERVYGVAVASPGAAETGLVCDIRKLATYLPDMFLCLYLLDLLSPYTVAWMVAERDNRAPCDQLFAWPVRRYERAPGTITVHNDRTAPMTTSGGLVGMLAQLGDQRGKSRPRSTALAHEPDGRGARPNARLSVPSIPFRQRSAHVSGVGS